MADKDKKDNKKKSDKKSLINFKFVGFIIGGVLGAALIIVVVLFLVGSYINLGPFAPKLSLQEQIEDVENFVAEDDENDFIDEALPKIPSRDKNLSERTLIIEDVSVNIKGTNGRRFIVASLAIESKDKNTVNELKEIEHWIQQMVISDLRDKTLDEVLDMNFQSNREYFYKNFIQDNFLNDVIDGNEEDDEVLGIIDSIRFTKLMIQ
jgi:flagellar basal body-associated protein FliL